MKSKAQSDLIEIKKTFEIESARYLPHLPKTHPCSRHHGHSFKITLVLRGPIDQNLGWLMDYNDVAEIAKQTIRLIDHVILNEVPGLENPTTENLTIWLYQNLTEKLKNLVKVIVSETRDTECSYPC